MILNSLTTMKSQKITGSHKSGIYDLIIEKVWEQFQAGRSIFVKEGGLQYWPSREVQVQEERDSMEFVLSSKVLQRS